MPKWMASAPPPVAVSRFVIESNMQIADFVHKELVEVNLKAHSKEAVISEIVDQLYKHRKIKDKNKALESLLKREELGTTGIGYGVAIPHARIANLKEAVLFAGVSKSGIDFSSADTKQVHLIILFLTPLQESSLHLKILSKIAAILSQKTLVKQLIDSMTNDKLYVLLKQIGAGREEFPALNKEEVYLELATGDNGVSEESAKKRLEAYGPNKLKTLRKTPLILRFLSNFTNLLAILMWVGGGLSFWAQMPEAGWACIVVVFVNAIFSFWQEFKSRKSNRCLEKIDPFLYAGNQGR